MRRSTLVLSLLWAVAAAWRADAQDAPRPVDIVGGVRSGVVVVRLKQQTIQRLGGQAGVNQAQILRDPRAFLDPSFKTAATQWGVTQMRPLYHQPFVDAALAAQLGLDRVYVVQAPPHADPVGLSASLAASADVEAAFADTIGGVAMVPNDPDFGLQYAMDNTGQVAGGTADADIDAVEAWSIHTGNLGTVTIAIIDSGVNAHSEYSARLLPGINTDDPGNPSLTTDACPHGTHVAGIAAAAGDNSMGVAGVTWGANILPVRVLNGCNGAVSALASGIVWAADNGADVLNISLQYYNLSNGEITNLQNAVHYAHGLGAIVVAAAGNNHQGGVGVTAYPARLANVLNITATDHSDSFAVFSNFGTAVDLCAPGKDIWSTWINDGYAYQFGTSMSTPLVSGAAALLWSYESLLTNVQIIDLLKNTADDLGPVGWDSRFGEGRLNVWKALSAAPCVLGAPTLEISEPEETPFAKSRAISFKPPGNTTPTALRIRMNSLHHPDPPYTGGPVADFTAFEGQYRWVGPPHEHLESQSTGTPFTAAELQCTPHYTDWGSIDLLHVFGIEVVPSSLYEVQSVPEGCPIKSSLVFSGALAVETGRWADIEVPFSPPATSQQPDVADISALVNKFRSAAGAPIKARALLAGLVPNLTPDVDFTHVAACVDAFRGASYPYPIPATCP